MKRVCHILEEQGVKYDKRVIAEVINKHFPDWRRVLNELQRYSASGTIDSGILVNHPVHLLRSVYDNLYGSVDPSCIPHIVVILGDYQFKAAFVADQEINMLACLTEIMARSKFK